MKIRKTVSSVQVATGSGVALASSALSAFATGTYDAVTTAATTGLTEAQGAIVSVGGAVALALITVAGLALIFRVFHAK